MIVDIDPIRQSVDNLDLGTELAQNTRHNLIGLIRAIHDNLHAIEALLTGAQIKFNIFVEQIRTVIDMTDMLSRRTGQIIILFQLMNDGLELIPGTRIRQFIAITAKELDTVVIEI